MTFGKGVGFLFGLFLMGHVSFAAEMRPVSPPVEPSLPPAVTLSSPPVTPLPPQPETIPIGPPPLVSLPQAQPPVTSVGIPQVSQPLRPPSPETLEQGEKKIEEEGIYFNVADEEMREVVKQISRALGKNFILDDKLRGKITIISERKMTKDETWEPLLSALEVNGYTIVDGPAGLLKIVSTREAISNPIDIYTEESPFTDRFITRLVTLKNISASDMSNVIKGLVSKEGNLFAYPVTNTLIITDGGANINRLLKLIHELDQEGPTEVMEIIPVIYAEAKDLAGKITQIFETDKGESQSRSRGKGSSELEEIPRLRKVIPDDRTNSLIVLASKMAIVKVRDLIRKLDSPIAGDQGEVHVYYLRHASAKDMASILNALSGTVQQSKDKKSGNISAGDSKNPSASLLGGAEFVGKFSVTADETTNALVITAGAKDYNTLLEQVVSKLDIPRRQVYVEAIIVELIADVSRDLGLGILGAKAFNVGGSDLALFGSTFGFLNPGILQGATSSIGGATTGNPVSVTPPGSTTATNIPKFFSALELQQRNAESNILSTPNILTMDNEEAEIKVGEKVPFKVNAATTIGGSLQASFTREDVVLSLKIKPQISDSDTIKLTVEQNDENVKQGTEAAEGGPTTTKRSIKTAIVTNNGQTVVLGGLIKDFNATQIRKVPLLGDIPILGYLFKTKSKVKKKSNLVVFLTPNIIRTPRDFLAILQKKINEQNDFIAENYGKSQQKQIHHSLEVHASHILELSKATLPPPEKPTSSAPLPAVPEKSSEPKKQSASKESQPVSPKISSEATNTEDSDLALEGVQKGKEHSSKKSLKKAESLPTSKKAGDDVDLAY